MEKKFYYASPVKKYSGKRHYRINAATIGSEGRYSYQDILNRRMILIERLSGSQTKPMQKD